MKYRIMKEMRIDDASVFSFIGIFDKEDIDFFIKNLIKSGYAFDLNSLYGSFEDKAVRFVGNVNYEINPGNLRWVAYFIAPYKESDIEDAVKSIFRLHGHNVLKEIGDPDYEDYEYSEDED